SRLHHLLLIFAFSEFSFFIQFYVALQVLHSFPTRRSSDLTADASACCECGGQQRLWALHACRCGGRLFAVFADITRGARNDFLQDRKSTRLNSSHVSISYAVFCLKKKKKQNNLL